MKFPYLWDIFEYCLNKSDNPKKNFKIKPLSVYFGDGVVQSWVDMSTIKSDSLSSPHQTTPPSQSNAEEHAHISVQLSHPPNITPSNFCRSLVVNPLVYHMHFCTSTFVFIVGWSSGWNYLVFFHSKLYTCCEWGSSHRRSWCCTTNMCYHSWRVWLGAWKSTSSRKPSLSVCTSSFFLASLMILPSLIFHVYLHP